MGGVVFSELIFGYGTDAVWKSVNHGRTFETIDWSKFKTDDDEDEEDDDDDDDGDEEEDDEEEGDDDDDDED
eukprot:CAMPEP_0171322992 /NCGR_PEP_ID=MMETSP0816-20121228/115294_1 /TAXON_ID=420281 /ORGANISM="Proboscia inermis, Strain CCAP1064/1" /LENGTH=71 /DNA_ID=CAMNT_0011821587 /DNA_START=604 /DNA_END=819 /DNA_ORIENTATION=+